MTYDITRLVFALDVVQSKRFPTSDPPLSFRAEGASAIGGRSPQSVVDKFLEAGSHLSARPNRGVATNAAVGGRASPWVERV